MYKIVKLKDLVEFEMALWINTYEAEQAIVYRTNTIERIVFTNGTTYRKEGTKYYVEVPTKKVAYVFEGR